MASDIIHAAGVRFAFPSSAPRARVGSWLRRTRQLSDRHDPLELVAEMVKVLRADAHVQHFFDHRQEISERTNGAQRRGIGGTHQAAHRRQHEGVFDHTHGHAALLELRGQDAVRTTGHAHRTRRLAVRPENLANVLFLAVLHDRLPQLCGGRSDGPSMCMVWQ